MSYPRGTSQRASMWLEHTRRRGWRAVAAVETDADVHAEREGRTLPEDGELATAPLIRLPTATAEHPTSGGSSRWCGDCTGWGFPARRSAG